MTTLVNCGNESRRLWTEDDFLALPETTRKTELLDGELIREPSADFGHQARCRLLTRRLEDWAATRQPRPDVCQAALDVRFAPGRILQPDVFVYLEPMPRPVRMPLASIPDLCVEIVSTERVYDRVTKRQIYATAGVREYWTVLQDLGIVERWTGVSLATRDEIRGTLATPLLPGFTLEVAELLADP